MRLSQAHWRRFDRAALQPGVLHLGLGAFHRAHQAVLTQAAIEAEPGPWGIVAVNLRSAQPVEDLAAQDGLYTVVTRGAAGDQAQLVGVTRDWLCAAADPAAVQARLADPAIRVVTLTVTEKAYGIDPATGGLDRTHPSVAADLARPDAPLGPVGIVLRGLAGRRDRGLAPFAVLCCDNLPANGRMLRRLVLEMAAAQDPALADWIAHTVAFPCSMVDRIVPAATDDSRARAAALIGAEDVLAVEAEPFIQWVIEDDFPQGRPAWDRAGAVIVADVEPYEKMKLRLLNGSHTLIAHLGILHGLAHVRDVMAVPELAAQVHNHMSAAARTLDPVPGIDLSAYTRQLIARFANPTIAHRNLQIAMDSTQKLPQRILAPAVEALPDGAAAFAHATGVWIAALVLRGQADDPRADELMAACAAMPPDDPSAPFLALPGLFPAALVASRDWRDRVNATIRSFRGQ
ncbi:mannitol dehydrogenase family protein [Paracoccus limosus]|uniref:Mannitol dehydrogenase family protein n=1 Tax=Paracoccus limosus TaxID=913252 RepID=A0A844HAM7_9RHOB|nr:mannitol dehydrogenase family protein [Paracoccus limosus]MTH35788.1 mannitol dehydrogenase family protein [Paracoccus limosus]